MPNGFHGSQERWHRITAPLEEIDGFWRDFARRHDLRVTENHRNWPERSLRWGKEMQKAIEIFLVDEEAMTFSCCLSAVRDRSGKRLWRRKLLMQNAPWSEIKNRVQELVQQGYRDLESWTEEDLEEV